MTGIDWRSTRDLGDLDEHGDDEDVAAEVVEFLVDGVDVALEDAAEGFEEHDRCGLVHAQAAAVVPFFGCRGLEDVFVAGEGEVA